MVIRPIFEPDHNEEAPNARADEELRKLTRVQARSSAAVFPFSCTPATWSFLQWARHTILGIQMPKLNGTRRLRHLRAKHRRLPVIVFSGHK